MNSIKIHLHDAGANTSLGGFSRRLLCQRHLTVFEVGKKKSNEKKKKVYSTHARFLIKSSARNVVIITGKFTR